MTKTLLQLATEVAVDVGLKVPSAVAAATDSTDRTMVEMKQIIDQTGEEIARRVDWASLRSSTTVTGTGAAVALNLPTAYDRMIAGNAVTVGGVTVRGGLSPDEFLSLSATAGTPRFYLVSGPVGAKTIQFWPYLANAVTASINFQSRMWNSNGPAATFTTDSDTSYFPDAVFSKGAIARWRKQKGMDFQDYEAEFETVLKQYANFDDNARTP